MKRRRFWQREALGWQGSTAPTTPGASVSSTNTVLPETAAAISAMTTPPTAARAALINTFILSLMNAGIWSRLDTLYVLAAATSQAALLNWKSPGTFTGTLVGAPTFTADRGYTGNGTDAVITTGWIPSTNGVRYTQNDASMWIRSLNDVAEDKPAVGVSTTVRGHLFPRLAAGSARIRFNAGATATDVVVADSIGLYGAQRRGASDVRLWKNGTQIESAATASTGVPTGAAWICGASPADFSSYQCASAAFGASLTGLETAYTAAELTYMQGVGAA